MCVNVCGVDDDVRMRYDDGDDVDVDGDDDDVDGGGLDDHDIGRNLEVVL